MRCAPLLPATVLTARHVLFRCDTSPRSHAARGFRSRRSHADIYLQIVEQAVTAVASTF